MQNKEKVGGEVIGSGGFGCVFQPALKCKGRTGTRKLTNGHISKLLVLKDAKEEYQYIVFYKKILKSIPNYSDYFLINDFSLCEPEPLTKEDLVRYSEECYPLNKINITKKNINQHLKKLRAIQMPFGGLDVQYYIEKVNYDKLATLNKSLIDLLLNGILPMNKKRIFHCDLKDSNVLVQDEYDNFHTRIIDWGLSVYIEEKTLKIYPQIPKILEDRPFQFNVPFSIVLFNSLFDKMYSDFLIDNPTPSTYQLDKFVDKYLNIFITKGSGRGHLSIFISLFEKMKKMQKKQTNIFFKLFGSSTSFSEIIVNYLVQILKKYTVRQKNGKLDIMDYFSNVFLHNIDVWGFVMIYFPIFSELYANYTKLTKAELYIFKSINELFELCFSASVEPISIPSVVKICTELNGYFSEAYKTSTLKLYSNKKLSISTSSERRQFYSFPYSANVKKATRKLTNIMKMTRKSKMKKRCPKGSRRNKKTGNCDVVK